MNQEDILDIFINTRLFAKSKPKTIDFALKNCNIHTCNKGDGLFNQDSEAPALYIILDGSASVYGHSKNKPVILNTLKKGTVFGMASLFGEKCVSTSVIAKENCTFAIITQTTVEQMLGLDIDFAKNYIKFLTDKIRFLNKKIEFFTSESAEKKLMGYILSLPYDKENKCVRLDIKISKLAQNLDIGRASLYRALDSLEEKCFIKRENDTVKITSYDEFKKIYGEQK